MQHKGTGSGDHLSLLPFSRKTIFGRFDSKSEYDKQHLLSERKNIESFEPVPYQRGLDLESIETITNNLQDISHNFADSI